MKTWPLLLAFVAAGVIGCGGGNGNGNNAAGGGGGVGGGPGGGGGGRKAFGVNFPGQVNPALLDVYLLPGQGRQAGAYVTAYIGHIDFTDSLNLSTQLDNPIPPTIGLRLDGYNAQNRKVNVFVPEVNSNEPSTSRYFGTMFVNFDHFETSDGVNPPVDYPGFSQTFTNFTKISVFPGRTTAVQIFLNDAMFDFTNANSTQPPAFNLPLFNAQNENPQDHLVHGFLSDYLSFDLTHVQNKPALVNSTGPAMRLFVSGDNYALSQAVPPTGQTAGFEVLTPFGTYPGVFKNIDPIVNLRTYQLLQPNPTSFTVPPSLITALEGTWFDQALDSRITATDSTLMISFPGTTDSASQQLVIMVRNGTTITNLYFGTLNLNGAGGAATFTAFPIGDIQPASTAGQIKGTVSGLQDVTGATVNKVGAWWQNVHGGNFTTTTGAGAGAPTSGRLVVYRY